MLAQSSTSTFSQPLHDRHLLQEHLPTPQRGIH